MGRMTTEICGSHSTVPEDSHLKKMAHYLKTETQNYVM